MTNETTHLPPWTLEELAEDTLSHSEKGLAMEHVRHCAQCAAEVDAHRALFRSLAQLPSWEPSPGFADAVMTRVLLPAAAPEAVLRRRWLPRTVKGWMMSGAGVLAPLLPLLALFGWLAGRGMSPGALFGLGRHWVADAVWSAVVRVTEAVVRSGVWEWLVTTGNDLVGGTRGLSAAAVVFAIAIPLSGWMVVRLLKTPMGGMTHAH
ncbi:hypothetical protein [Longimicrobium sp.]|uniref:hypothetical protein n=1 Tax=Longimicrobium sp. TaxID=2029185 RepID=UPI002CD209A1|nr:hypothetical protein [Longimicrobium sp.]HSU12595.1 hypothetical protein [Longimicrobium sp.]